ncbi:sensor histidine kinase [Nocardiopsis baichengensis]|uniref:sensor histidine kinase n=1 Tax=Nocardiopsis baichengensis TaxID=280240 RepID=UPI001EF9E0E3|nr:histidine kinase [Nocardiopsis baichengensis]
MPATLPRLAALVRLLLQLRMLLCAMALLLIPADRITNGTLVLVVAVALLSGLAARNWERFVPYLRSHPILSVLDILGTGAILVLDGPSGPAFLTTLISSAVAGILFEWRHAALVALFQVFSYACALLGYAAVSGPDASIEVLTYQALIVHPALYAITAYLGVFLRRVLTELASEQVARRSAERAAAAAEERERLARDMHDSVAKTLRGTAMAAQALPLWLKKDPERAEAVAKQIVAASDAAAAQARELISDLRDHEDDADIPFAQALGGIVGEWSKESGIEAHVSGEPASATEPRHEARQEALAILKEALTNVERHSGAAAVDVTVETSQGDGTPATYSVVVTDDGLGFQTPPEELLRAERTGNGHYGLLGMVERAERVGGSLVFESPEEGGTTVRLVVPASTVHDRSPAPQASA